MRADYKPVIGIVISVTIWQLAVWLNLFNPIYFASPIEVIGEAIEMIRVGSIFSDIYFTLYRLFFAIFIATIFGLPIGLLLGYFSSSYRYFEEIVDFLRSIPPIVIFPLLLIIFGPGDSSRIGVAAFGAIVVLILVISKGLFQQSPLRKQFFKAMGAKKSQILKYIVWYEALPHIIVALRTALSLSLIIIVVTEMLVGAKYGLGVRVQNVQITANIPDLFTTIIIIGLIGVFLNKILIFADRKFIFWKTN
jgi:ABC-type nitrate/sulfonate/bicarbonate transport system permease component